jgi:hypothetical protein
MIDPSIDRPIERPTYQKDGKSIDLPQPGRVAIIAGVTAVV